MRSLSARELLNIWEAGARQPLAQRALWLLSAAQPDMSFETLAQLPIGRRDAQLVALRERLFGAEVVSVARCPQCNERLQVTFRTSDFHTVADSGPNTLILEAEHYTVQYRLPNSADLLILSSCDNVEAGRRLLISRCLQTVQRDGVEQPTEAIPPVVIEAVAAHMAQADPQADVQFDLNCPTCAYHWQAAFDVSAFLWAEIDRWAGRMLQDVHVLARAYGWSEADILSLSATRRQAYLDLIGEA